MLRKIALILFLFIGSIGYAQEEQRIETIKNQLTLLSERNTGLTENLGTDISVNNISLANFLLAMSELHEINMTVDPELRQIMIVNNFTNVTVGDLLVFLCKKYDLAIEFTGNILSISKYQSPVVVPKNIIPITYFRKKNLISLDLKDDKLYEVFKRIMDESGKNIVFAPGLENKLLTAYIQKAPFDVAMDKLAFANNLFVEKTDDNFYLFEKMMVAGNTKNRNQQHFSKPIRRRNTDFFFQVLDSETKLLKVDIVNTPIAAIINDIANELEVNVFTASPLQKAGIVTRFKSEAITFDKLLTEIFKMRAFSSSKVQNQTNPSTPSHTINFTYKKEDEMYFFGTADQLSVHKTEIIPLMHRSVTLLDNPTGGTGQRIDDFSGVNRDYINKFDGYSNYPNNRGNQRPARTYNNNALEDQGPSKTLLSLIPENLKQGLIIETDFELNSFYVSGPSVQVDRFKTFLKKIDKPIPVVLIEVMFIEFNKSALIETGVTWGIGDEPKNTKGSIYPSTELTLGAQTINEIITGFNGFGVLNIGQVVPNFFATIKAMETNGKLKIRSTPKLATLNGHRATFSRGKTSYYAVTQRNIYGVDNPQISEITNYVPINAKLGLTIKPMVSGNGQVTLDIFVIQSSFGARIDEKAPPDINSRKFSSIIRVQDQDIVVLGGLEKQMSDNSGTGVPFLSKIPIIKWLFSSRKRESSKSKLTVFIKPIIFE